MNAIAVRPRRRGTSPRPTLLLVAASAAMCASAWAQQADWKDISVPPLHPFTIPTPQRVELPNGLTLFLMEDHELPLIDVEARIRGGERDVPADKAGLGDIFGEAWRAGGTKSTSGDKLDETLEARAAKVETSVGQDSMTISMNCLKADFPDVLKVFVDVLQNPALAQDKIDIAKKKANTEIARRNDSPDDILWREAQKLGYGKSSPYARVPEYATIAAITRDDLLAWHARYVHPNRMLLGIVGDFQQKQMLAEIKKALGGWPKGPDFKDPEANYGSDPPGMYFVEKEDVTQANIAMVHLGIRRDDPDYFAAEVMNEILSGGFPSRLFTTIRSQKGLAYAVYGRLAAGFDRPGLFFVSMGTKNSTVAAGLDALREEIDGILGTKPLADVELKRAKDSILNSFVFQFDSKEKVLGQQMTYAFYGYPADFIQRYRDGIEKVTMEDVARVAKSHIHPEKLAVVVVGKSAEFDKPLASFGEVRPIDITIPVPGAGAAAKGPASADSIAKGKEILAKTVASLGGKDKLSALRDLTVKGSITMKGPMGEMAGKLSLYVQGEDRRRQDIETQMGAMTQVVAPSGSFMAMGGQAQDMPASRKKDAGDALKRDVLNIARHADDPKLKVTLAGNEKVGDADAVILDVENDGVSVKLWVEVKTGQVLRKSYQGMGPAGPAETVSDYSDYKQVDGMWLAHAEKMTQGGEPVRSVTFEEYKLNAGIDPKLFEKPAAAAANP